MLREANEERGCVAACTTEGRHELLDNFQLEIDTCERSLMEYLNEKKKVFARFYFASDQALLDILSNGTNPEIVDEYVGSLFDGLNHLEFVRGPGIVYPSRSAKAMISSEKEIVPFTNIFTMAGPVESYLNELEKTMQNTLRDVLETSKHTADSWDLDGKKRHIWLEDYCA
jgi:dynein heavy chain